MKKLIFAWITLLLVTATFAQQSEQEKSFLEKAVKMEKQLNAENDSKVKEQILMEYIAFFYKQPQEVHNKKTKS